MNRHCTGLHEQPTLGAVLVASLSRWVLILLIHGAVAGVAWAGDTRPEVRGDEDKPYAVFTTHLPPFTVETGPDTPGALVEVVKEMGRRMALDNPVEYLPWARAQFQTQKQPRSVVLPLTRTPEREEAFHWMVRLYRQNFVFIGKRDNPIRVDDLDDVRKRRIVVLRASPNAVQLRQHGVPNYIEANTVDDMVRMLRNDMVDAIYGGEAICLYVLAKIGIERPELKVSRPLESGDIWLGASPDLGEADAQRWQKAMAQLRADGTYSKILLKYHLPDQ